MTGFVIEMRHRFSGERKFIAAGPARVTDEFKDNLPIVEHELMMVDTLEETRGCEFSSLEHAQAAATTLPDTKNIEYLFREIA